MERESRVLKHGEIVQPFLIDAFRQGAHRTKPKHRLVTQDLWFRQIMIGVVYNDIGSTATLEELGEKHGTFRQSIADSNKYFLRNLWNNSSPELQERYPLDEILTARKPLSQRSKEKFSLARGGISLRIKEQVENGVTDRNKISENTGIPKKIISAKARTTLNDWGVNVPRKYALRREVLVQLDKETDDTKIQELLDGLPYSVIQYSIARKGEASKFSPLSPLIREAGFHLCGRDTHFFATSLKSAGVPISRKDLFLKDGRRLTYYVLLSRHKDRIIQVLRDDQSLQRFRR